MKTPTDRQAGFTLVELLGSAVLAVLLLLTLQSTLQSSIRSRVEAERREVRHAQAYDYLQRLQSLPFGTGTEGAPTPAELTELFDDDDDTGPLTLRQVQTPTGAPGHSFTTQTEGTPTLWRVQVSDDLDRDGDTDGPREGRGDLLMIEIFAEGRLMFRTMRAADVTNTRKD